MTFVLISSSATMAGAVESARQKRGDVVGRFLAATVAGGVVFLGMQAVEWTHLIEQGARLTTNPWGHRAFGAYFFLLTGFHRAHVLTGVITLATTAVRAARRRSSSVGVEMAGLYWHFVDLW